MALLVVLCSSSGTRQGTKVVDPVPLLIDCICFSLFTRRTDLANFLLFFDGRTCFLPPKKERELFPGQSRSGSCHHQPPDGSGSIAGSIGSGCRRSTTTTAVDEEQPEPPASVLTRRRALVPPKIPPYNMDSSEDTEQSVDKETSTRFALLPSKRDAIRP